MLNMVSRNRPALYVLLSGLMITNFYAEAQAPIQAECESTADSKGLTGAAKASYIRTCISRRAPPNTVGNDRKAVTPTETFPELPVKYTYLLSPLTHPTIGAPKMALDIEAQAQGLSAMAATVSKCGSRALLAKKYSGKVKAYMEINQPVAVVGPSGPLSEVDKLNGIEWIGSVALYCKATRQYSMDHREWDDWESCYDSYVDKSTIKLQKKNGQWIFPVDSFEPSKNTAVACSVVPPSKP